MKKTLILSFIISLNVWANEAVHEAAPTCDGKATANCSAPAGHEAAAAHGRGHGDLSAKMNSLFPQPEKNPAVTVRPTPVKISAPAFMAGVSAGSIKLEWVPSELATSYHVQIATDPQFKWLVVNETSVKGNSYDFAGAEAGKRYFWRVAATKYENDSMFTESLFTSSSFDVK